VPGDRHTPVEVGTTAGREISDRNGLIPCLRPVPAATRSQRLSVTSAGRWIIPLVGPASAQKRLAQPTESVSHHPICETSGHG